MNKELLDIIMEWVAIIALVVLIVVLLTLIIYLLVDFIKNRRETKENKSNIGCIEENIEELCDMKGLEKTSPFITSENDPKFKLNDRVYYIDENGEFKKGFVKAIEYTKYHSNFFPNHCMSFIRNESYEYYIKQDNNNIEVVLENDLKPYNMLDELLYYSKSTYEKGVRSGKIGTFIVDEDDGMDEDKTSDLSD